MTQSLRARAIACLARREYSRLELRRRLLRGSGEHARSDEVDALLDALAAEGYLSDVRYADALVTRKAGSYSRRAIADALKAQGVAGEAVEQALAGAPIDDEAAMATLWRRRFGRASRDDREKARQVRFLQSRGFALSAILKFLRAPPEEP